MKSNRKMLKIGIKTLLKMRDIKRRLNLTTLINVSKYILTKNIISKEDITTNLYRFVEDDRDNIYRQITIDSDTYIKFLEYQTHCEKLFERPITKMMVFKILIMLTHEKLTNQAIPASSSGVAQLGQ